MARNTLVTYSLLPLLALLAGCSSTDGGTEVGKEPVVPGDETYGEPIKVTMTIPGVAPGEEGTRCMKVHLGNEAPLKIGKVHNLLSPASHHLVVSSVEDPAATAEPLFECRPFRAVLEGAPFTVTQKHDDLITMPEGVGFPIVADQLMHLEMHYINTGEDVADVVATSELFPLKEADDIQEASFLIIGNLGINIPANSVHTNPEEFVELPAAFQDVNFYAATGHTHRYGTSTILKQVDSPEETTGRTVYNPEHYSWTEAELTYHTPPFKIPAGGGFRFTCSWENPTSQVITYGESALQEMCFFWTYFYPRQDAGRTLLKIPGR
jgi:hypothetical protein